MKYKVTYTEYKDCPDMYREICDDDKELIELLISLLRRPEKIYLTKVYKLPFGYWCGHEGEEYMGDNNLLAYKARE